MSLVRRLAAARSRAWLRTAPCTVAWSLQGPARRAVPAAVLHLTNGGFVAGELTRRAGQPNVVRWQPTAFVAPFDFALTARQLPSIFPSRPSCPSRRGTIASSSPAVTSCSARCLDWTTTQAEIEVPRRRADPHRAIRASTGCTAGSPAPTLDLHRAQRPGRLAASPRPRRSGGRSRGSRWTDQDGAARSAAISSLPARATLEFEISWKNRPDFVFAPGGRRRREDDPAGLPVRSLGARPDRPARDRAGGRRGFGGRDHAGAGTIHLLAYLDQERGRILVFSADGKPVADLKVAPPSRTRWAASRWPTSGAICGLSGCGSAAGMASRRARSSATGRASIGWTARSSTGRSSASTPRQKSFLIREDQSESRIPRGSDRGSLPVAPRRSRRPDRLAAVYQDGSRLSGEPRAGGETDCSSSGCPGSRSR